MVSFNNCLEYNNYSKEEQKEVAKILKDVNNLTLNKFIIDYYNLRTQIRICNE